MKKQYGLLGIGLMFTLLTSAQVQQGKWNAKLLREDGHHIPFELDVKTQKGKTDFYVVNGTERLKTESTPLGKDSLLIRMPVFESSFRVKLVGKDSLHGVWVKGGTEKDVVVPFVASAGKGRFPIAKGAKLANAQGRWKIDFTRANGSKRAALGEFTQKGQVLRGSVLTPSGDYRYLDGIVNGDSLAFSTFDGIHALLFTAKLQNGQLNGNFYSGASSTESWTAVQDANAKLEAPITQVKEDSDGRLNFSFKDLDGQTVSFPSDRYKDKVVIIQLMGSWCPNCMDEMAFLSEYYHKNKARGVEVIALAYELTTDAERSRKSLSRFQEQFKVEYPMLNTGVAVGDPKRTEKTLPQITDVKVFPTSIIIDKNGVINEINTAFSGPATGEHFLHYKAEFERKINSLLSAK